MNPPVVTASQMLALREFHAFEAHGARFLYMVPSAGIFRMDGPSVAILDALDVGRYLAKIWVQIFRASFS